MGLAACADEPTAVTAATSLDGACCFGGGRTAIHRLYNSYTGDHLYGTDPYEAQNQGYHLEGYNYFFLENWPQAGHTALYRCYAWWNDYFLSTDPGCEGMTIEQELGQIAVYQVAESTPLYRLYKHGSGDHFYTTDYWEGQNAISSYGYVYEGITGYVYQ
ncbi:MAG TPA: hypothetical protein VHG08_08225 [Longimicrobium sp.]|nr:hypothetical protein [Longimicrobium sp.]